MRIEQILFNPGLGTLGTMILHPETLLYMFITLYCAYIKCIIKGKRINFGFRRFNLLYQSQLCLTGPMSLSCMRLGFLHSWPNKMLGCDINLHAVRQIELRVLRDKKEEGASLVEGWSQRRGKLYANGST